MDASSGESGSSSYSVDSIASFSSLTFERYTRRSLRHLMLTVYREQLLAKDDLPNQRIQALLDQYHTTLVDQPDHFLKSGLIEILMMSMRSFSGKFRIAGVIFSLKQFRSRCDNNYWQLLDTRGFLPEDGFSER